MLIDRDEGSLLEIDYFYFCYELPPLSDIILDNSRGVSCLSDAGTILPFLDTKGDYFAELKLLGN